jgi:hypothetical protein
MALAPSEDEVFLLELILIPAIFAIVSVLVCEYGLFGKERWSRMSDAAKSLSMFLPISMFLYLYFWAYLLQYPLHGFMLISVPINLVGFFCSVLLLRDFLLGKRTFISFPLMFAVFLSSLVSSEWISTLVQAFKGVDMYTFYVTFNHLKTGWTFIFGFGLLTPIIYVIGIVFKDPSFLFPQNFDLDYGDKNNLRTLLSIGISVYSLLPLIGNLAFAPLGLGMSILNLYRVRNTQNFFSFAIGLSGTILFAFWLML